MIRTTKQIIQHAEEMMLEDNYIKTANEEWVLVSELQKVFENYENEVFEMYGDVTLSPPYQRLKKLLSLCKSQEQVPVFGEHNTGEESTKQGVFECLSKIKTGNGKSSPVQNQKIDLPKTINTMMKNNNPVQKKCTCPSEYWKTEQKLRGLNVCGRCGGSLYET